MTSYRDTTAATRTNPCVQQPMLYLSLDPDFDDVPAPLSAAAAERLRLRTQQASMLCAGCDAFVSCLRDALYGKPVGGFVAGTTEEQRRQIRAALRIKPTLEDGIGRIAGAPDATGVNRERIVTLIAANPDMTNCELARLADCDNHTIARYRRTAAAAETSAAGSDEPAAVDVTPADQVSTDDILAAYYDVYEQHERQPQQVALF